MNEKVNPANKFDAAKTAATTARKRIPMSRPQRQLEVPDIEGYHLHWFLERNVSRALDGGYEFVDPKETALNPVRIGSLEGNQDLGSRVSMVGGVAADGQPERLILMKIKQEYFEEDQAALVARNKQIEDAIRLGNQTGSGDESSSDRRKRYVKDIEFKTPFRK